MGGTNIKKYRKLRGMSISELAAQSGVSKSYLSNLERNLNYNPSIQIIERIAKVLNIDRNLLLSDDQIHDVLDPEWKKFIDEAKQKGITSIPFDEYKELIDFIHWKVSKKDQ